MASYVGGGGKVDREPFRADKGVLEIEDIQIGGIVPVRKVLDAHPHRSLFD